MLLPRTEKARCATVSPTADAITVRTACCVSWLSPVDALACCSTVAKRARSRALRMRSSRMSVSEKESRICFGVIRDTPPRVCSAKSSRLEMRLRGRRQDDITKTLGHQEKYVKKFVKSVGSTDRKRLSAEFIGKPGPRPSTGKSSRRLCNPVPALPRAPDAASFQPRCHPRYRCPQCCRAIRWDWPRP